MEVGLASFGVGGCPNPERPPRFGSMISCHCRVGQLGLAGREGFEPSRELYTPYPLSRRVLSATQPPPRSIGIVARFYRP